jgi:hypothetical protein
MKTKLTEQESLEVITQMIQQAQNNFQKGDGNVIMFWGYLVAFTALLNFALAFALPGSQSNLVWLLMIPGWMVAFFMRRKTDRSAIVKTHIDRIINSTVIAFGISVAILQFVFWAMYYYFDEIRQFSMMAPVVLLFTGAAHYVSGKAYRFQPYVYGGFIFWLGAIVCLLILPNVQFHFLVLAICMVFGYIIPGGKLNKKNKEIVQGT